MSDTPRYTIRQRGYSSYADTDDRMEALRLRRECERRLGSEVYVLIYDNVEQRDVTVEISQEWLASIEE